MSNRTVEDLLAEARETYGVFGKPVRALAVVDRALEINAKNVEALNLKAAILYELDRDAEAEAYHLRALEFEPNSVEALHGLAALANDREEYGKALEWTKRGLDAIEKDPSKEFIENDDYRQRLIAELVNEKAFALWYTDRQDEARTLLTEDGPTLCPLEVETLEDQLDWLEHHPESPEE